MRHLRLSSSVLTIQAFRDVMLCCRVSGTGCSEGSQCLHLQGLISPKDFLSLKMKKPWTFQTLGTTHPTTQHHSPEYLNTHFHCYKNNMTNCLKLAKKVHWQIANTLNIKFHIKTSVHTSQRPPPSTTTVKTEQPTLL